MIVVKQKAFYLYGCMSDFERFKEQFSSKEKFICLPLFLMCEINLT